MGRNGIRPTELPITRSGIDRRADSHVLQTYALAPA